jgi:hypothetical protein
VLEHSELVLRPWAPAHRDGPTAPAVPARPIFDSHGDTLLGVVVWRKPAGWQGWPWARRERFEVYETEDEPLLMTVSRGWGNSWKVHDADERLVGQVRGGDVFDGAYQCLAVWESAGETWGRLMSGEEMLAEWARKGDEVRLTFTERLDKEPFAKMVLLAAVLTQVSSGATIPSCS